MSLGATSVRLVPLALASRGAAFLIPVATALWFGAGSATDAWFWALSFPTFALVVASSSLGTAALPAIARMRLEDPAAQGALVGGLLGWALVLGAGLGTAAAAVLDPLIPWITGFDPATQAQARRFLWALVPFLALTGASAVLRVTNEVYGRFRVVALTPVLRAAVVIAVVGWTRQTLGPMSLPLGLFAGELGQALWWALGVRLSGVRLRPGLHLDPRVRAVGRDLGPILGGEALVALNPVVDKAFAAALAVGSVARLEYADRARVIPQTLLESTLLMVAFATWSNLRAGGRGPEARAGMGLALAGTVAVASPVLAGMYIGREVLVALLFERGAFSADDTEATARVLAWYVPGILPALLATLAARAHIVERRLGLVFRLGVASAALNATGNAVLIGPLGLEGLALSTSLTSLVVCAAYLAGLRIRPHRPALPLAILAGSIAVATAVELGPGTPERLLDPVLAISAVGCLLLLHAGLRAWRGAEAAGPRGVP